MPRLITCVALPPYLFYTVSHSFQRDQLLHMIYGSLIPFVSMLLTFALAYLLARLFRVKEARRGCSVPACRLPTPCTSACR